MNILKRQFLFGLLLWGVFATQAFALTQIESFKTPKGIHVWLVPDKTVQAITIAFSVPGGAIMTADKAGVSGLTERMLSKGSGPYTNHQFQELLEGLGIEIGAGFSADYFSGSLRTTYDNRTEAFRLFKEYINHPRFESSEFELVRQEYLTYVQNAQKSPAYVLERMIAEKFFPHHPYGIPMDGTPQSLKKLTVKDLKSYLTKHQMLAGLNVVVCGNLSVDETRKIIDEIFGSWPVGEPYKGHVIDSVNLDGKIAFKDFPGGQSIAQFYQKGLSPKDKDFVKLVLVNMVLGAFSSSRLFEEIREKRGLVYTVNAYPATHRDVNFYAGGLGSDHTHIDQSINLVRSEWSKIQDKGITEEELKHAKTALLGAFAFRFASTLTTAQTLLEYMQEGFTPQYVADRSKRIAAVTLSDMNAFIKNFFTPDKLTFFVVGQKVPQVLVPSMVDHEKSHTRNVSKEKK